MDRRVDPRVEVRLPCHVSSLGGRARFLVGVTENMSRRGILVFWNPRVAAKLPIVGELLNLEIELPTSRAFGRKCISCQVTAVRVIQPKTGGPLVAFQINQMQFRDYGTQMLAAIESQQQLRDLLM